MSGLTATGLAQAVPEGIGTPNVPPFLNKLYEIVTQPSTDEVIAWSPEGNSFVVHQKARLEAEVLSTYFKHDNFQSFVRQQAEEWSGRREKAGPPRQLRRTMSFSSQSTTCAPILELITTAWLAHLSWMSWRPRV